jgi:dolichol-phosphate mannosyltransferase
MVYLSAAWVWTRLLAGYEPLHLHQTAIFYYCITAVLLGAQWLAAGLIAELFTSVARRQIPPAAVAQTTASRTPRVAS